MSVRYLAVLLSFLAFLFVLPTKGQQQVAADYDNRLNDSILNIISNIDVQIERLKQQRSNGGLVVKNKLDSILDLKRVLENIHIARRDENGMIIYPHIWLPFNDSVSFMDTMIINSAYLPIVFDGRILPSKLDFRSLDSSTPDSPSSYKLIDSKNTFETLLAEKERSNQQRKGYYTKNLRNVAINALKFPDAPILSIAKVEKKNPIEELLSTDHTISVEAPEVEVIKIEKLLWKIQGAHTLRVSQRQVSDNWKDGGENNFAAVSRHLVNLDYKRDKISLNNEIEWRLSMKTTPADTVHSLRIDEDFLRLKSVLGLESFIKKWSYTMSMSVKTPLFTDYRTNIPKDQPDKHPYPKERALFSPMEINLGIGTKYSLERKFKSDRYKKFKLDVNISPFSVQFNYVSDKMVDETRFGKIKRGKSSNTILGSNIDASLRYDFNRYMYYISKLNYFTTYEDVVLVSENKFSFLLNRYLSASLELDFRFDDSVGKNNKKHRYFQYNELLSFGLEFNW